MLSGNCWVSVPARHAIKCEVQVYFCVRSAQAQKVLKEKLGTAERILKVAELCRKLETEQEKILPFWDEQAAAAQAQVLVAGCCSRVYFACWDQYIVLLPAGRLL